MEPREILALPMGENDAHGATVGDYLKTLLLTLWKEKYAFSGKRPFGDSDWDYDLVGALVEGGAIEGSFDEDGYLAEADEREADRLIADAIEAVFAPARTADIGDVTSTAMSHVLGHPDHPTSPVDASCPFCQDPVG